VERTSFRLVACLLSLFLLPAAAEELQLEQVVLVSRHGVRSPTNLRLPLEQLAAEPWPRWPVGPGELTPQGAKLATIMGGYYRAAFAQEGLLAREGCPRPDDVFVWSDVEERTRASAQAMLDGMYPGCGLKPVTQPDLEKDDPLFHPTTGGVCKLDGATARAAILGRVGGDIGNVMQAYAGPMAALQEVLRCCAPTMCRRDGLGCTLPRTPTSVGTNGRIEGGLYLGAALSEILLLEHANGFPAEQVGWGRVDEAKLLQVTELRGLYYELAQRTLYPAQRYGSNLLDQVLETMRGRISGKKAASAKAPAASRLVMLVGHDSNIANLGGMLNVDWALAGYQPNETPPGGALAFQLYRGKASGQRYVRMFYYAQSPRQLREVTKLDAATPPLRAEIALPGCAAEAAKAVGRMACPWATFERLAASVVVRECVGAGQQAKVSAPKIR